MRRVSFQFRSYAVACCALLTLVLAACSGKQTAPPAQQQAAPAQSGSAAAPAPAPTSDKPVTIRVGDGFAAEEQLWLMKARPDLTPNQGKVYTLQLTPFRANDDRLKAYMAGELDAGTMAGPSALFAGAQGLDFRVVASLSREAKQGFKSTFMVLDDSAIKNMADLKGKTVGIVDYKSGTDMWARSAITKAGLTPDKDVKIVVVPFPAMGDAVRTKKIDAGVFVQPFYSTEVGKGGIHPLFNSKDGVPFDEELMLLFFSPDFIAKHRNVVQAFIDDFRKANDYYIKNTKDAKKSLVDAKLVTTPVDAYQAQEDWYRSPDPRVDVDAMQKMLDITVQMGWISQKYDFTKFIDNSFYK